MANAKFIGWQTVPDDFKIKPYPLFTITIKGHPLHQSTVSEATLRNECIDVPTYPTLEEWHLATSDLLAACKAAIKYHHLAETSPEHRILQEAIDKAEGRVK